MALSILYSSVSHTTHISYVYNIHIVIMRIIVLMHFEQYIQNFQAIVICEIRKSYFCSTTIATKHSETFFSKSKRSHLIFSILKIVLSSLRLLMMRVLKPDDACVVYDVHVRNTSIRKSSRFPTMVMVTVTATIFSIVHVIRAATRSCCVASTPSNSYI